MVPVVTQVSVGPIQQSSILFGDAGLLKFMYEGAVRQLRRQISASLLGKGPATNE